MTRQAAVTNDRDGAGRARRMPTQKRSRARFEKILACAADIIAEKGSDDFRMSDIVERSGIAFGSLYQYFPDKTAIIATLAERYNARGHDCVRTALSGLHRPANLHTVLCRICNEYHAFLRDEPVARDIWQATQVDRDLQRLDAEDGAELAAILSSALGKVFPDQPSRTLATFSQVVIVLIAAAVRHAITLPQDEAAGFLASFKEMLPRDVRRAADR